MTEPIVSREAIAAHARAAKQASDCPYPADSAAAAAWREEFGARPVPSASINYRRDHRFHYVRRPAE